MLRAVATCQNLHGTLAKQLNNAVRFRKTEWVILGEIEAADFNNRVGQILGVKPEDCSRCAVQVDGLSCKWQNQKIMDASTRGMSRRIVRGGVEVPARESGSRMVGLSRFKLYAFRLSNRGMLAAVRIHAHRDLHLLSGPLQGKYEEVNPHDWGDQAVPFCVSETQIPRELAMFTKQHGTSPLMADLERPIVFRQILPLGHGSVCGATTVLLACDRHGVMGVDVATLMTYSGPNVVAWLDQADFTLDNMCQVFRFHAKVRFHHKAFDSPLSDQGLQNMWQESATKEPVTETIFHDESPATIKPDEARTLVEVQHESTISHGSIPSNVAELACIVTFHRTTEALDRAVRQSDLGQRLQEMGQTLKPAWANGAKILVEGVTQETWTRACQDSGLTQNLRLRPGDVVLPANALTNILGEIQKIPHSSRPRLKAGKGVISIPDLSQFADLSDNGPGPSSSSVTFDSSLSSQDASESGWSAFIDGLRDKILHVPIPSAGYTSQTYVHEPEEAPVTPRSNVTQSDSANAGINIVNPRIFR